MMRLRACNWRRFVGIVSLTLIVVSMVAPAVLALTHGADNTCGCIGECTCGHGMMMNGTACARGVPTETPTLRQCRTDSDELTITSVELNLEAPFELSSPGLSSAGTFSECHAPASADVLPETPPPEPST